MFKAKSYGIAVVMGLFLSIAYVNTASARPQSRNLLSCEEKRVPSRYTGDEVCGYQDSACVGVVEGSGTQVYYCGTRVLHGETRIFNARCCRADLLSRRLEGERD